jgi:hypothetical protein
MSSPAQGAAESRAGGRGLAGYLLEMTRGEDRGGWEQESLSIMHQSAPVSLCMYPVQLLRSTTGHGTCHIYPAILVKWSTDLRSLFAPWPCSQLGCGGSSSSVRRPALDAPMHVIGHAPPYTRLATVFAASGHTWRARPGSLAYLSGTFCSSSLPSRIPYLKEHAPASSGPDMDACSGPPLCPSQITCTRLRLGLPSALVHPSGTEALWRLFCPSVCRGIGALGISPQMPPKECSHGCTRLELPDCNKADTAKSAHLVHTGIQSLRRARTGKVRSHKAGLIFSYT